MSHFWFNWALFCNSFSWKIVCFFPWPGSVAASRDSQRKPKRRKVVERSFHIWVCSFFFNSRSLFDLISENSPLYLQLISFYKLFVSDSHQTCNIYAMPMGFNFLASKGLYLLFMSENIVPLLAKFSFLFLLFGFWPLVGAVLFSVAGICFGLCCIRGLDLPKLVMSGWSFSSLINFSYHKNHVQVDVFAIHHNPSWNFCHYKYFFFF